MPRIRKQKPITGTTLISIDECDPSPTSINSNYVASTLNRAAITSSTIGTSYLSAFANEWGGIANYTALSGGEEYADQVIDMYRRGEAYLTDLRISPDRLYSGTEVQITLRLRG